MTSAEIEDERIEREDGTVIKFFYDEDPEHSNPREMDGNVGTMFVYYRGYTLGDEQLPSDGFGQIDCPACEGGELPIYGPVHQRKAMGGHLVEDEPECPRCENFYMVEPTVVEWLADKEAIAAEPLFVYEHGGITMRPGRFVWLANDKFTRGDTASHNRWALDDAGWDTSFVGLIIATRDSCEDAGIELDPEKIKEALDAEVSIYASYLQGEVYGFVVEPPEDSGVEGDSCWGFLGELDYCKSQANESADYVAERIVAEKAERAEWAARDVVTA